MTNENIVLSHCPGCGAPTGGVGITCTYCSSGISKPHESAEKQESVDVIQPAEKINNENIDDTADIREPFTRADKIKFFIALVSTAALCAIIYTPFYIDKQIKDNLDKEWRSSLPTQGPPATAMPTRTVSEQAEYESWLLEQQAGTTCEPSITENSQHSWLGCALGGGPNSGFAACAPKYDVDIVCH